MKTFPNLNSMLCHQLKRCSDEYGLITVKSYTDKVASVREAMERYNKSLENVSIELDGIPVTKEELSKYKMEVPSAFNRRPVVYTSEASFYFEDGKLAGTSVFGIEVIN